MGRLGSAVSYVCVLAACTLDTRLPAGGPSADGGAALDGADGERDGSTPDHDGTVSPRDAPMNDAPDWDAGPPMPTEVD